MRRVSKPSVFLGIDAHSQHCTFHAIDRRGGIVMQKNIPTISRNLRAAARQLPEDTWAILEASTMAFFVKETLDDLFERIIVCETRENRWIAQSNVKSDAKDAERLARLLRMGEFKEVHVPSRPRQEIRELVGAYQKSVGDVVRAKNRLNVQFRRHGVRITESAYGEGREDALRQLKRPGLTPIFDVQYAVLDAAEQAKDVLDRTLRARLSPTREYKLLQTIPGVGPVCGAIMVAIIDQPHRFATKRHLWSYAGIGASSRSSGNGPVKTGGTQHGNRLLKYAATQATQNAIRGDNRFARHHRSMLEQGIEPAMAKKTVARDILATALAMWKAGSVYRENNQAKSA